MELNLDTNKEVLDTIQEYIQNEKEYLSLVDNNSDIQELFTKLKDLEDNRLKLLNKMGSNIAQTPIVGKKVDPYIRGGMAEGIAGPAVGLYAALKADAHNIQVDENNKMHIEMQNELKKMEKEHNKYIKEIKDIIKKIDSNEAIFNKRQKKLKQIEELAKEHDYNTAIELMNLDKPTLSNLADAKRIFKRIVSYKDSYELLQECEEKFEKQSKHDSMCGFLLIAGAIGIFLLLVISSWF